jgi:hypothetical protein
MRSRDAVPPPALRTFHCVTDFVEDLLEAPPFEFLSINELSVDHFCNFFALPAIAKFSATLQFSATLHWF